MHSTFTRPYQSVLQSIAAVWLIVAVGMGVVKTLIGPAAPDAVPLTASPLLSADDLLLIAGISGLIAIASTIPGLVIVIPRETGSDSRSAELGHAKTSENAELSARHLAIERLGHAFLAGMLIRITGTVALFLASSYYMDASPTRIGIWVLGWHLTLLLTEVIVLSRQIPVS